MRSETVMNLGFLGCFVDVAVCRSVSKEVHSALEDVNRFVSCCRCWSCLLGCGLWRIRHQGAPAYIWMCLKERASRKITGGQNGVNGRGRAASEETYLHQYSFLQIQSLCQSRSSGYSGRILRIRKTCLLRRSFVQIMDSSVRRFERTKDAILNSVVLIRNTQGFEGE